MFSAKQLCIYLYCSKWILNAFLKKISTGIWLFGLSVHPTTLSYSMHEFEKRGVYILVPINCNVRSEWKHFENCMKLTSTQTLHIFKNYTRRY